MDMVQLEIDPTMPTPLLDRLKAAPGQLKALLKDTTVECIKNVFTLLVTHFPQIPLEHAAIGVTPDFNADLLPKLTYQYHDVVENIVDDLDL
uniref:Uncharacterized protein n=1 Tax=Setaria italica TaxID=4555 RepID=K3YFR4_SETIT